MATLKRDEVVLPYPVKRLSPGDHVERLDFERFRCVCRSSLRMIDGVVLDRPWCRHDYSVGGV